MAVDRALEPLRAAAHGQRGRFPEFYFFDCQSCHRPISDDPKRGRPSRANPGRPIPSGMPPFNDENMIMLSAAARVAGARPGAAVRRRQPRLPPGHGRDRATRSPRPAAGATARAAGRRASRDAASAGTRPSRSSTAIAGEAPRRASPTMPAAVAGGDGGRHPAQRAGREGAVTVGAAAGDPRRHQPRLCGGAGPQQLRPGRLPRRARPGGRGMGGCDECATRLTGAAARSRADPGACGGGGAGGGGDADAAPAPTPAPAPAALRRPRRRGAHASPTSSRSSPRPSARRRRTARRR